MAVFQVPVSFVQGSPEVCFRTLVRAASHQTRPEAWRQLGRIRALIQFSATFYVLIG